MRGTTNSRTIMNSNGKIYAICLGADYTAEHERGIGDIYREFGIDPKDVGCSPVGIESRIIKVRPNNVHLTHHKIRKRPGGYSVGWKGTLLVMPRDGSYVDGVNDPRKLREMYDGIREDDTPLSASWSDGDFAVFARKDHEIEFLKQLYEAIENGNAVVWQGYLSTEDANPVAGLCFGILDLMPDDHKKRFIADDSKSIEEVA